MLLYLSGSKEEGNLIFPDIIQFLSKFVCFSDSQHQHFNSENVDETFVSFYHNIFLIVAIYYYWCKFFRAMKAVCMKHNDTMTLWERF